MQGSNRNDRYAVVWPRGEKTLEISPLADRLGALEGKTICQLWDYLFRGDEIFPMLADGLAERYPGVTFITYDEFGSTHGEDETKILAELPARLEALGADAVISGMGC